MSKQNKVKKDETQSRRIGISSSHFIQNRREENTASNALSRLSCVRSLTLIHCSLCYPGSVQRTFRFPKTKSKQQSHPRLCLKLKPQFFKPPLGRVINATKPSERRRGCQTFNLLRFIQQLLMNSLVYLWCLSAWIHQLLFSVKQRNHLHRPLFFTLSKRLQ